MSRRLAGELHKRGRPDATSVYEERLGGLKDGALFKALSGYEHYVLVTWDNRMPLVHAAEIEHFAVTLAVIDRRAFWRRWVGTEDAYRRDVVHRSLHRIELQPEASIVPYR